MKKYFIDNSTFKIKILIFRTKSDKICLWFYIENYRILLRGQEGGFFKKKIELYCVHRLVVSVL